MRVGELINKLKQFNPDDVVVYDTAPLVKSFRHDPEAMQRRTQGAIECFEQGWGLVILSEREIDYSDKGVKKS